MKRLIPAVFILTFTVFICIYAHTFVKQCCTQTIDDVKKYSNDEISAAELENSWKERKEKMAIFVNHGFLDNISLYIGQLTLSPNNTSAEFTHAHKNIESTLALIKAEQKFGFHSFY